MSTIKTWRERCPSKFDELVGNHMQYAEAEIAELRAALAARATPAQPVPEKHPLFYRKLADLQQRGYEIFGHILHKNGEYALFDDSCRWLTQPQYWRLMHEQDGSLFATQSPEPSAPNFKITEIHGTARVNQYGDKPHITGYYERTYTIPGQPSPSSVGAAIRALLLPEPFMTMRFNAKASRWDEVRGEAFTSDTRVYSQGQVNEIRAAAAALAEQVQGQQVPEGWRLVPVEPTPAMVDAYNSAPSGIGGSPAHGSHIWDAMLAAAPSIAQDGQKSEGA